MRTTPTTGNSIRVAFKASNGKYVTADNDGHRLQSTSDTVGSTANFHMIHQEDKAIALMASNGKYICNENNGLAPLQANRDAIGSWETFEVIQPSETQVALKASNGKYICNENNGLAPLQANRDAIGSWETFELVLLSENGTPIEHTSDSTVQSKGTTISLNENPTSVYTVCFSGTACTRDEGEVTRPESDKRIYCNETGYIPVRIHKEVSGDLRKTTPSVTIRGVGENDWAVPRDSSEHLIFNGPLNADQTLLSYVQSYSGGNQLSTATQFDGWSAPALALHAANLAAASGMQQYNFIGHSRGAVECIMAAWFLYAYGPDDVKNIPINIFAIDPVPGTGEWYGILTQLPPNVVNYVGVYAWDMCIQPGDKPFMALVPRPNGLMTEKDNHVTLKNSSWWPWNKWKYIADDAQLTDPLKTGTDPQPQGYELYACRGRHSTVAGNSTADGKYSPNKVSETVDPVPQLIYKMARGYLTQWGTTFPTKNAVDERVLSLRKKINTDHREFDAMGGGETRTSALTLRPYVRRLSSIYGINPANSYYMDNVVGNPPYKMDYPVTIERTDAGWVKWKFL